MGEVPNSDDIGIDQNPDEEEFDEDGDEEAEQDDREFGDIDFADPGGNSALRAATADDPRIHPCPTCKAPNRLTLADKRLGYQCNTCADRMEHGLDLY